MPIAPRYETRVAPGNIPTVQYGQVDNQFSGLAQGVGQLGAGAERFHVETGTTLGLELSNKRDADLMELSREYSRLSGKAAIDKQPEYWAKIEAVNAKYKDEASKHPYAAKVYERTELPAMSRVKGGIEEHSFKELDMVQSVEEETASKNSTSSALAAATSNKPEDARYKEVDANIRNALDIIDSQGRRKGVDLSAKKTALVSQTHYDSIDNLTKFGRFEDARRYFDKYKGAMTPNQQADANKMLSDRTDSNTGAMAAQADIAAMLGDPKMAAALKAGNTEAAYAKLTESFTKFSNPTVRREYAETMRAFLVTSEQTYVERTHNQVSTLEKQIGSAATEVQVHDIIKQARTSGIPEDQINGVIANRMNRATPADPGVIDDMARKINELKTPEDYRKFQLELMAKRSIMSNVEYGGLEGMLDAQLASINKTMGVKAEDRNSALQLLDNKMRAEGISPDGSTAQQYNDIMFYGRNFFKNQAKAEDLNANGVNEWWNTFMKDKKWRTTTIQSGSNLFWDKTVEIPLVAMSLASTDVRSFPNSFKFSGDLPSTPDQLDALAKGMIQEKTSRDVEAKAQAWAQTLDDNWAETMSALEKANPNRKPTRAELLNAIIEKKKAEMRAENMRRAEEEKQRKSAPITPEEARAKFSYGGWSAFGMR